MASATHTTRHIPRAIAVAAGLWLLVADVSAATATPPLTPDLLQAAPQLHVLGQGMLRAWFWKIYDIALYVQGDDWREDAPYALAVIYARPFTGEQIADEGIKQMRHEGQSDPVLLARWHAEMVKAFPQVVAGDRVVAGFLPPDDVRFYLDDRLTDEVKDPAFARAFFGIWLGPDSTAPKLRRALLQQAH